jgi:chromosome segregation ATPase
MRADQVGFYISLEPVETDIIYSRPKKVEEVQPSEEVFPTQYSPPFIQQRIITQEPVSKPEPIPEVEPVTLKTIVSCKTLLNNRINEIASIKSKDMSDAQDLLLNRQMYDQRISAQNSETVQQYKSEANISNRNYLDALSHVSDLKAQNKDCQKKKDTFNFNYEQVRNCCSNEAERASKIRDVLYEKCTADKLPLIEKLSKINNQINSNKDLINQLQAKNDSINTQIDTCNKEVTSIQDKIKNC